jgi:cytochrome P450
VIARYAAELTEAWQPGALDLHPQMLLLALRIVGKCLFDMNAESEARKVAAAVDAFMLKPPPAFIPLALLQHLQKLPFGPALKIRTGLDNLDKIIYGMIAERRRHPGDRGDLLSMLLAADDHEEDAAGNDTHMSDKQVRDECLTVILAGHETTANALSFALWMLAKHPDAQENVHNEAVRVLDGRRPNASDYPALRHAYMVFAETMRLYPTVWVLGRNCGPDPYDFRGFVIEPGSMLLAPQIVVHRDARFWTDPETFNPLRFAEESKSRPKFAYFPFGGGSRQCIGEGLAWMEGVFVLATICRDWRVQPLPGAPETLPMTPSINLRPKHGVPLMLARR